MIVNESLNIKHPIYVKSEIVRILNSFSAKTCEELFFFLKFSTCNFA